MSGPSLAIRYTDGRPPVSLQFPEDADPFAILAKVFKQFPPTAPVAQLAERGARNSEVAGSRPAGGSTPPGMRDTSRLAYRKMEATGKLGKQEREILQVFLATQGRTFTRNEVAAAANIKINSCTARINKMIKAPFDVLEEVQQRRCRISGETCWELRLKP